MKKRDKNFAWLKRKDNFSSREDMCVRRRISEFKSRYTQNPFNVKIANIRCLKNHPQKLTACDKMKH